MAEDKKFVLGQYFTNKNAVKTAIGLIQKFKRYPKAISILEPSAGTGNFVAGLEEKKFGKIDRCEIDPALAATPLDFFELGMDKRYDLVIGNPPFTKYNIGESYFYPDKHPNNPDYLPKQLLGKKKIRIENAFILKSIRHMRNKNSSIGFVLPISFFIANENREVKEEIKKHFSTIIIYQNGLNWVDAPIPCCFAIFTNMPKLNNKIILVYQNGKSIKARLDISQLIGTELIPKTFLYKKMTTLTGIPLKTFLEEESPKYLRSYEKYSVSARNIIEKKAIPAGSRVDKFCLAITRVGNGSVGRTGLVNPGSDILNGMFYLFSFKEKYCQNKEVKERICAQINERQDYFKNITMRVGSKSIKRSDILNFRDNF